LVRVLILPAFSISTPYWCGASYITLEFVLALDAPFTLQRPIRPPTGVDFCLAVRYVDDAGAVHRFKLWTDVGEDLDYPKYAGELLPADVVLEVWTTQGNMQASLVRAYVLSTSLTYTVAAVCASATSVEATTPLETCELFADLPTYGSTALPLYFTQCISDIATTAYIVDENNNPIVDEFGNNITWM